MKPTRFPRSLPLATCALGAVTLCAQDAAPFDFGDPTIQKNRLSVSAKFAFGYSAEIRNRSFPGKTGPESDDGFVKSDLSGNAGGKTWNWGYESDSQVSGDALRFHTVDTSPRNGHSDSLDSDFAPGVELSYGRELKRWALKEERAVVLGAEIAIAALDVDFSENNTLAGTAARTTRSYNLDGVLPPGAPYAGTFNGPGPLLDATPSSVVTESVGVTSALNARVRSHVYGLRLGPFLEVPIGGHFNAQVSLGLAAMYANTTLSFTEALTFDTPQAGLAPAPQEQSFTEGEFVIGFYGRATLGYDFNPSFRAFVGAEYMHLGETTVRGGGKEATLDLTGALQGVVGVQLLF